MLNVQNRVEHIQTIYINILCEFVSSPSPQRQPEIGRQDAHSISPFLLVDTSGISDTMHLRSFKYNTNIRKIPEIIPDLSITPFKYNTYKKCCLFYQARCKKNQHVPSLLWENQHQDVGPRWGGATIAGLQLHGCSRAQWRCKRRVLNVAKRCQIRMVLSISPTVARWFSGPCFPSVFSVYPCTYLCNSSYTLCSWLTQAKQARLLMLSGCLTCKTGYQP